MAFAKITLSGTVASAPEKRFTQNNTAVSSFMMSVASPPRFNGAPSDPFLLKVTCWARLASAVAGQIQVGDTVVIDGKLQMDTEKTPEGTNKKSFAVEATSLSKVTGTIAALDLSEDAAQSAPAPQAAAPVPAAVGAPEAPPMTDDLTDDDIPF